MLQWLLVIYLLLQFPSWGFSENKTVHYEPEIVELHGILELQTFPGPPNYESIKNGDAIERGWYLKLDHPIIIKPQKSPTDLGWKIEYNVRILQLSIGSNDIKIWRRLKAGKRIKIQGTLFNRHTGHHHSRALMSVDSIVEEMQ